MANASAAATQWNLPNYVGEVAIVNKQTSFLNDIGGYNWATAAGFRFPCGNLISLETPAQPAITETASLTAPTPVTYVADQEFNVCQIFQKKISMSYARLSDNSMLSGITVGGVPVEQDPKALQILANLRQLAADIDQTFLNGAYQIATNAGVAYKTRGIVTACTVNTVDAGADGLAEADINTLLEEMATNGADFEDLAIYANSTNLLKLGDIYGFAPMDRRVGGVAIERIVTPFGEMAVRFDPQMVAGTVLIADRAKCRPVALPVPEKGVLFYETLSKTGAGEDGQIYGQIGLDYGSAKYHGTVTNTHS